MKMGNGTSNLSRLTANDVGLYVGRIGSDYKEYESSMANNSFDGSYIIFKFNSNPAELFQLFQKPGHVDSFKYQFTTIHAKKISIT
jgi:hypothetical protein